MLADLIVAGGMTPEQVAAFEGANPGSPLTVAGMSALSGGLLASVVLVWFGWVVIHAYRAWGAGRSRSFDAGSQILRGLFVTVVVLAIVSVWG